MSKTPEEIARLLAASRRLREESGFDAIESEDDRADFAEQWPESAETLAFYEKLEAEHAEAWHEPPKPNGHDQSVKPFVTIDASSWAGKPRPRREWLDERELVPFASVTNFAGIGAVGKTLLMLQLSISCATGTHWLGATVRQGPALFYSAEEPITEIHTRIDEITEAENIQLANVKGLHVIDLSQVENATLIKGDNRTGMAGPTDLFRQLEQTIKLIKPVVVILDNRGLIITGNENDRTIAAMAMRLLRLLADRENCAIILLSHPSNTGASNGSGASGSTGWFATGRSALNMTRPKTEDGEIADKKTRVLTSEKANYAEQGTAVNLRWEFYRFVCTDPPLNASQPIGVHSKAERVFMELLRWHADRSIDLTPTAAPKEFGNMTKEKRQGFNMIWFKRAMESLLDQNKVHLIEGRKAGHKCKFLRETIYNS